MSDKAQYILTMERKHNQGTIRFEYSVLVDLDALELLPSDRAGWEDIIIQEARGHALKHCRQNGDDDCTFGDLKIDPLKKTATVLNNPIPPSRWFYMGEPLIWHGAAAE